MSAWEVIIATIASEFSDLSDIEHNTRVALRLLLAIMLGGLLGYERESQGKAAGLRTHILVSLGAALFVLGADPGGVMNDAMSRVIQGVVAGVGFLGAGTILKSKSLANVRGLTTAAGLWLTAAMGVAVGLGQEVVATMATLLALITLHLVPLLLERNTTERTGDE
ncbi:MgtC/SapB family protein [Halopseudomonas sp.]|uniref:MgtC/SapB family protein n=1 Tax=Halopseudomonas sp. TaxID=2901191 RepID=UPI0035662F55